MELFGDLTAERATGRLLSRLQADIKACDENGQRTAKDFAAWRTGVQALQLAVLGAQSKKPLSHLVSISPTKKLNLFLRVARRNQSKLRKHREHNGGPF